MANTSKSSLEREVSSTIGNHITRLPRQPSADAVSLFYGISSSNPTSHLWLQGLSMWLLVGTWEKPEDGYNMMLQNEPDLPHLFGRTKVVCQFTVGQARTVTWGSCAHKKSYWKNTELLRKLLEVWRSRLSKFSMAPASLPSTLQIQSLGLSVWLAQPWSWPAFS